MTDSAQSKIKKVLFYANAIRAFRATHIGHLYEIVQKYPTILLSEKLDSETEKIINDKKLFPKLEKIIPVDQCPGGRQNLWAEIKQNKKLHKLAKDVVRKYKPDVLITSTDIHSLFEMYLFRFAKRTDALKIVIQPSNIGNSKAAEKWVDFLNTYLRFPEFLPFWLRLFLVKCRKYFGHFLYLWVLPLLVGERPFLGKASYILRKGNIGMGDSDCLITFSKRDYDVFLKDGVPPEKLYILAHPLARKNREFFEKVFFNKPKKEKKSSKVVLLLFPIEEIGFRRKDYSLIRGEERYKKWKEIAILIFKNLPDWKIIVKPHPDLKDINEIKSLFSFNSGDIEVVDPKEQVDKFIEIADIIVGLPLSSSTTLFTASLQCPEKPILSLDFLQEVFGDYYKNFEGIEYIDNKDNFVNILQLIRDNKYQKKYQKPEKRKLNEKEFPNTVAMIESLLILKDKITS